MTTRRVSRSRSRSGRGRRKTTWFQANANHSRTAGASLNFTDISHPAITANNEPTGTCRRLIGNWAVTPQTAVAGVEYNISLGIAVMTIDALTAGATPDPAADVTQDWYWWDSWEGTLADAGLSTYTNHFDIRTARRIREGYRLVLITENLGQELASFVHFRARTLWSMP